MTTGNKHEGARAGAGRKPKALIYANEIAVAEAMMVGALPRVTAKLIALAEAGDIAAIRLLFDRIMGRPAQLEKPLSKDTSIPYVEDDLGRDLTGRFLNDFDTDEMHNRQFEERFYDKREEAATVEGDGADSEAVAEGDDVEKTDTDAGEPSPAETSATDVSAADDDVEEEEESYGYYYDGDEVKVGRIPSRNGQTPRPTPAAVD